MMRKRKVTDMPTRSLVPDAQHMKHVLEKRARIGLLVVKELEKQEYTITGVDISDMMKTGKIEVDVETLAQLLGMDV